MSHHRKPKVLVPRTVTTRALPTFGLSGRNKSAEPKPVSWARPWLRVQLPVSLGTLCHGHEEAGGPDGVVNTAAVTECTAWPLTCLWSPSC